ncbi:hypothetical protein BJ138DRAFT_1089712 [Hygrophoropsis aurantiaca]|uniref:Uncharacterized protein n=1 Tax=Hygrophoropsis aurantiaca TaxID=72124 RepID=A0ACB8A7Q4_9AGAM|nr:hypothetical protein BJ138DRAFT_1089712 [Hygrophoropsis aurantiaca]
MSVSPTSPQDLVWAIRLVNYSNSMNLFHAVQVIPQLNLHDSPGCFTSVASLTFLVWEILVTLDAEVQHIWPKPRTAIFKWVYLSLRYGALTLQIFHQFAVPYLTGGNATDFLCKAWLVYAMINSQVLTTSVEFILMIRVYALYNKSRRIALLLFSLFILETVTLFINSIRTMPNLQTSEICVLIKPAKNVMYYSLAVLLTQSTLLALTVTKHVLARRTGFGRTPLVSQLTRDGTVVYAGVLVLILMTGICCSSDSELTMTMFFLSGSISPTSGCRLIMNMQRLSRSNTSDTRFDTVAQFTTEIEINPINDEENPEIVQTFKDDK